MRELLGHKVNPANDTLTLSVLDKPGQGNACHVYRVDGFEAATNDGRPFITLQQESSLVILFQNGPIAEVGVNGITNEVLLEIVADRLRGFQSGPYACKANACALTHIEEAQHWLQQRTLERMQRGVEGTHNL